MSNTQEQELLTEWMGTLQKVEDGQVSALDVAPDLYQLKQSFSELYDQLKDHIIEERGKYNDKEEVIRDGFRISVVSRKYYSYKHDPEWQVISERKKAREKLMQKAAEIGQELTDSETGETASPATFIMGAYPKLEFVGVQV